MPLFSYRTKRLGGKKTSTLKFLEVVLLIALLPLLFTLTGRALCKIALFQIARLTNTKIKTSSVNFKLNGSVFIKELVINPEKPAQYDNSILKAEKVYARFDFASILLLHPKLKKIRVKDFVFNAQQDMNTGDWNLSSLKFITPKAGSGKMPQIRLKEGTIQYSKVTDGKVKTSAAIPIDMEFGLAVDSNGEYQFRLTTAERQDSAKSELTGRWREGSVIITGGIGSEDIPALEKVWTINVLAAELKYEDNRDYLFEVRIKDLASKQNFAGDTFGLNKSALLKQHGSFIALLGFLDEYRPRGQLDIYLRASGNLGRLDKSKISGKVNCKDVSICRRKFPYSVDNITGGIDFTEEGVVLNGLSGRHGNVNLSFNGWSKGFGKELKCQFQITSGNMVLDKELYDALSVKRKKLWSEFSPRGLATINYSLSHQPNVGIKKVLTVELMNAEARYVRFPYPLKNITGKLLFEADSIVFSNMGSRYDGRQIGLNGRAVSFGTSEAEYDIEITAKDIPMDSELESAIPEDMEPFGNKLKEIIRLGEGNVSFNGRIWSRGKRKKPFYELSLFIGNMELNKRLFELLPDSQEKMVVELQPTGKINLGINLINADISKKADYSVRVELKDNSIDFKKFPYPLKKVNGCLEVDKNSIVLRGIEAVGADDIRIGRDGPNIKIDGKIMLENGIFESGGFSLCANDILLDERLGNALGDFKDIYFKLSPTGRVDMDLKDVSVINNRNDEKSVDFGGLLRFKDCSIKTQPEITRVCSDFKMKGSYQIGKSPSGIDGVFISDRLRIKGKSFTNLRADISYDSNNDKRELLIENIAADCHGGVFVGSFKISNVSEPYYLLQTGFKNVNLRDFLADAEGEKISYDGKTSGKINGSLSVKGKIGDENSRIGRCSLSVTDMQIGKLSPIAKLLYFLKLTKPEDFAFSEMLVESYLQGWELFFEKFDLSGRGLAFNGTGRLDLKDQKIDLDLMARGKRLATAEPTVLQSLGEGLGYSVVRLEVKGNLYDPEIETKALPVIKETLKILGTRNKN
ncbi:MAG: hypothetical protein ACYSSI_01760 [Planctomycetota bacterium]|jgi:hypothetical protein